MDDTTRIPHLTLTYVRTRCTALAHSSVCYRSRVILALLFLCVSIISPSAALADAPGTRGPEELPQGGITSETGQVQEWQGVRELPLPNVLLAQAGTGSAPALMAGTFPQPSMPSRAGSQQNPADAVTWLTRLPNIGNWGMDMVLGGASALINTIKDAVIDGIVASIGGEDKLNLTCDGGGNNFIVCTPPALFFGTNSTGIGFGTIIPTLWEKLRPLEISLITLLFAVRLSRVLKSGPKSLATEGKDIVFSFMVTVILITQAEQLLTMLFTLFNFVHSQILSVGGNGSTIIGLFKRATDSYGIGLNFASSFMSFVLIIVIFAVVFKGIVNVIKLGVLVLVAPVMGALYFDISTRSRFTSWLGRLFDVLLAQTTTVFFLAVGSRMIVDQPGPGAMLLGTVVIGLSLGGETLLAGIAGAGASVGTLGLIGGFASSAGRFGSRVAVRPVSSAITQALPGPFRRGASGGSGGSGGSGLGGGRLKDQAPPPLTAAQRYQQGMTSPLSPQQQQSLAGPSGTHARQRYAADISAAQPDMSAAQVQQQAAWRTQASAMAHAAATKAQENRALAGKTSNPEKRTALLQAAERQERAADRRKHFAQTGKAKPLSDTDHSRRSTLLRDNLAEAGHETHMERENVEGSIRVAGERIQAIPTEIARVRAQTADQAERFRASGDFAQAQKTAQSGDQRVATLRTERATLETERKTARARLPTLTPPVLDTRTKRTATYSPEARRLAVQRTNQQLATGGATQGLLRRPVVNGVAANRAMTTSGGSIPSRVRPSPTKSQRLTSSAPASTGFKASRVRQTPTIQSGSQNSVQRSSVQAQPTQRAERQQPKDRVGRAGYRVNEQAPRTEAQKRVADLRASASYAESSGDTRLAELQRARAERLAMKIPQHSESAPNRKQRPSPVRIRRMPQ